MSIVLRNMEQLLTYQPKSNCSPLLAGWLELVENKIKAASILVQIQGWNTEIAWKDIFLVVISDHMKIMKYYKSFRKAWLYKISSIISRLNRFGSMLQLL